MLRTHTNLLLAIVLCATLVSAQRQQTPPTKPPPPAPKPGTKTAPAPASAPSQQAQAQIGPESHIRPTPANFQFPSGQTLHYTAEWRLWTAGTVSLKMEAVGTEQKVTGTADAT